MASQRWECSLTKRTKTSHKIVQQQQQQIRELYPQSACRKSEKQKRSRFALHVRIPTTCSISHIAGNRLHAYSSGELGHWLNRSGVTAEGWHETYNAYDTSHCCVIEGCDIGLVVTSNVRIFLYIAPQSFSPKTKDVRFNCRYGCWFVSRSIPFMNILYCVSITCKMIIIIICILSYSSIPAQLFTVIRCVCPLIETTPRSPPTFYSVCIRLETTSLSPSQQRQQSREMQIFSKVSLLVWWSRTPRRLSRL